MRRMLVVTALLSCGTFCPVIPIVVAQPAAPPPPSLPPPPQIVPGQASSAYPQNLLHTIEMIEEGYVRTVSRLDLLYAALSGLYEVAGEPVPASLRAEAEKAIKAKDVLRLLERTRKLPEIAKRVNDDEALLVSCRAMLRVLDPYCEILMGDEARRSTGRMDNFGTGIDLEESSGNRVARIKEVLPGSPAQRAGLRPGDRLIAIDGKRLPDGDAFQATLLLNGQLGGIGINADAGISGSLGLDSSLEPSRVRVTFERDGDTKPREVSVERRQFHTETVFGVQRHDDNTWDYWVDRERKIAQVRIGPLRGETTDDLRQVLSQLREAGMRGVLLDLRSCPGGFLGQSVKVAGLFLDKGRIYSAKGRGADHTNDQDNKEPGPFRDLPILLLVNGETSGGGELIAAALQDHRRAPIAGQRTRGKASVQIVHALPARGAFLKLTGSILIRPSGKNLNRFPDSKPTDDWGVRPDDGLDFRISAALDRQLREWWAAQTLRPGGSRERLPLDDPNADPQRQPALQALRERIK